VTSSVEVFAAAATQFCDWAEGSPGDEASEAATARVLLARLFVSALALRDIRAELDPDGPTDSEWQEMFRRFGALPFNYYSTLDPHVVPGEQFFVGDLADDLADIWRDLKRGLVPYRAGDVAGAEATWRERFNIHWGRHAAEALWALQCWHAKQWHK
jgi:hypothetical protein